MNTKLFFARCDIASLLYADLECLCPRFLWEVIISEEYTCLPNRNIPELIVNAKAGDAVAEKMLWDIYCSCEESIPKRLPPKEVCEYFTSILYKMVKEGKYAKDVLNFYRLSDQKRKRNIENLVNSADLNIFLAVSVSDLMDQDVTYQEAVFEITGMFHVSEARVKRAYSSYKVNFIKTPLNFLI